MTDESHPKLFNWTAIAALYLALACGLVWMLYWGDYRNAAWLVLLGTGGAFTAYGRVQERRGREARASQWKTVAALVYLTFAVWAGVVLLQAWIRG